METGEPAMTIEIHRPELEALILERMKKGAFQNVEDVLMQALQSAPPPAESVGGQEECAHTGAELVAAMQASPYQDIDLTPQHYRLPVRDVVL
jgi:hypothetical protein